MQNGSKEPLNVYYNSREYFKATIHFKLNIPCQKNIKYLQ